MSIFVIVGTDTGVGKTWVGCGLSMALCQSGRRVVAVKPFETGCGESPSEDEDGAMLARSTGQTQPLHALLRFRDPVAPAVAAERTRQRIDFDKIIRLVREYASKSEITLVEGAGGLLSPFTWEHNAVDLAHALKARVLLVASDRLGTLNHTLMTLKILGQNRLDVVGLILTPPKQPDNSTGSNASALTQMVNLTWIHYLPRVSNPGALLGPIKEIIPWLNLAEAGQS